MRVACMIVLAGVLSCGSSRPAPPTGPVALSVPKVPEAVPPNDRAPPPLPAAPSALRGVVRIGDVAKVARALPGLALGASQSISVDTVLALALGRALVDAVDIDAAIDGATIGAGSRAMIASFALAPDGERVVRGAFELRSERGLSVLHAKEPSSGEAALRACAIVAAPEIARPRLVCATDAEVLHAAAIYLVRVVGPEPLDADARITMPSSALHDGTTTAAAGAASEKLAVDLVSELERELERVDVDVRFGVDIEVSVALRFTSRESPLARALVATSSASAPPQTLFRLPDDSLLAFWSNGAAPDDLAPLRSALASDLQTSLEADGYQRDAVTAVLDEMRSLFLTGGPLVVGAGTSGAAKDAVAASPSLEPLRAALAPWVLVGLDEPPARWTDGVRALVKMTDAAERSRKRRPANDKAAPRDGDAIALRIAHVPPLARLPKDTVHVEVKLTPRDPQPGARTRVAHLYVVPHGERTWLGYSEDDAGVRERLRAAIDSASEARTLSRAPIAAALRAQNGKGGAAATLAGLAALFAPRRDDARVASARSILERVAQLPNGGRDALTATIATDTTPGRIRFVVRGRASRSAASDVLRFTSL